MSGTENPSDHRSRRRPALRRVRWLVLVATLFALGVLFDRLVDAVRGRPVREVAEGGEGMRPPAASSADFPSVAGALAGTVLSTGHRVEVLTDRSLFDALLRDLAGATRSITFHVYYCEPGSLGDRLAEVLAERARGGVEVLFLADGFACRLLVEAVRPRLEAAGADVAVLRPPRWWALHRVQHRNHSRMVVVDGTIGYTGGFGVADDWIGDAGTEPWRDTSVRFTGPAVRDLQAALLAAWAEATGILHAGDSFFPSAVPSDGDVVAGLLHSQPGIGTTAAERAFAVSAAGAERTLFIANAYFVPTPLILAQLEAAEGRGVDVRLLLPGPRTDVASTRWVGRGYYGELMEAGVRIFEYRETMMHAKTTVVDGIWSSVGSMNLDNRSMRLNDEVALLIHDLRVGATLDSLFMADLGRAEEIDLPSYRARPVRERFLEWVTRLVAPVL